ncbi:hypothetical protein [Rickettsia endosymbiont of Oedothorax gibbosus]|uniref:hypothetical protein n=1 Tax=Rickettsia endosymbiont of Oedothorax gibbosus TaxID=931099 RepID=UPI0020243BDE|nr:hypothetical protein [Rickettsia endosymbiont of Oedothorax gibbosus]
MKNIFYTEFWRKYYPVILCFALMFFHFLSAYPGGMMVWTSEAKYALLVRSQLKNSFQLLQIK